MRGWRSLETPPAGRRTDRACGRGVREPEVEIPSPLHLEQAVSIFRARGFDLLLADANDRGRPRRAADRTGLSQPGPDGDRRALVHLRSRSLRPSRLLGDSVSAGLSDQGLVADFLIGKRRLKIDVARQALEAAERSRADAERVLLATVKEQYIHTVLARVLLDFARETADSLGETARLVNDRLRAGDASEADAARAERRSSRPSRRSTPPASS